MSIFKKSSLVAFAAVSMLLALSRCGTNTPTGPASGTFTNIYTITLKTACIECHMPGGKADLSGAKFDVTTQQTAFTTLTTGTVAATDSATICSGVKLVAASDAKDSYLAAVLFTDYDTPTPGFAGVANCAPYTVHHQDQNLSPDEKTSIIAWIQAGAQNN